MARGFRMAKLQLRGVDVVGNGHPPDEGAALAKRILDRCPAFDHLEIDLRGLPASILISSFFHGFLSAVYAGRPGALPAARRVALVFDHDFQSGNAARWMRRFRPAPRGPALDMGVAHG